MTTTFTTHARDDGLINVMMSTDTALSGQLFSASITITQSGWDRLQQSAKTLAYYTCPADKHSSPERVEDSAAVRDAYLAFAVMTPQYKPDGSFHTEMFMPASAIFSKAIYLCSHRPAQRADDAPRENAFTLATHIQRETLKLKSWVADAQKHGLTPEGQFRG